MAPMLQFPRGSVWRKWDLHIHSPLSLLNNQFPKKSDSSPDWEVYLQRLESVDLAAVGITDYFTIDGYKRIREFKDAGRLANIQAIFPNVEFRLKTIVSSRKDGEEIRLNLHVIFSDELSPLDIEEHFLHDIHFYYQGDPQNRDETRKLKLSNLEALGKNLLEQHEQFRKMGLSALQLGAMQAVVDDEEITQILTNDSRFKGKYLIVLAAVGWDDINWHGQAHLVRKGLLQKSDMVFSSSLKTREWCLGRDPYKEGLNQFITEFKTFKPCIHGSDAHRLENIAVPCAKRGEKDHVCSSNPDSCDLRYCWIKADPTFEGLRQLPYEPADRVAIQATDPTPIKSGYCVAGVEIEEAVVNDELSVAGAGFPLNSALVAVAGGKGSGKTALLDLIANCFMDRSSSGDPNSFVERVVKDNANFRVTLRFKGGDTFEKKINDQTFFEDSEIVYIAQGELERYIGDNSDMDKYINDLIFESPHVKNTVKAFEFDSLAQEAQEIQIALAAKHESIEALEIRTADTILAKAKLAQKQTEAELKDIDTKIPELEARLSKEKVGVIREKQKAMAELQGRKTRLLELRNSLVIARQFLAEDLPRFDREVARINEILSALGIEERVPRATYTGPEHMNKVARKVEDGIKKVVSQIETAEKELKKYEAGMQQHARYLNRKSELTTRLEKAKGRINEIKENRKRLRTLERERSQRFGEMLRTVLAQKQKYTEIIELFGSMKAGVLSDLDFIADVQFNAKELLSGAQDILDNRQVEVMGDERVPSVFEKLLGLYARICKVDSTAIDELVAETERLSKELGGKIKRSQAISAGDLYRCLYGNYLSITPVVTYKKTALIRLSLGQKATVLIKIYLAQGTNPIVIDSHDDHLDNEFIMDELVGAIRQAKSYRQVILASNNGNVVVNSDAEQLILAKRELGKISYIAGSLENPVIRERALKILEGGAEAFRKRQQKYRISGR